MPNGNGQGPAGAGPMTGRGAGYCAGNSAAGWEAAGQGAGRSRQFRRCGPPRGYFREHAQHTVAAADAMILQEKIDALQAQLTSLQSQLVAITGQDEK